MASKYTYEVTQVQFKLEAVLTSIKEKNDSGVWYKVPFTDVISLVGTDNASS